MEIAAYSISTILWDNFSLDGGAMFGSIPKTLWSRKIVADEKNRIPLCSRSLLLESKERLILIDVGLGEKWDEKQKEIYAIERLAGRSAEELREKVTDIVLTHLHFDHAAGISSYDQGKLALTYPNARIHLQIDQYRHAKSPGAREQASFIEENILPLEKADLNLVSGDNEILPNIRVFPVFGHTKAMQWVLIGTGKGALAFVSDLIPTAHHLSVVYVMGYDLNAERSMQEKESFLNKALENEWQVVFQHDRDTVAGTITKNEKGRFTLKEKIEIPSWGQELS